MEVEFTVKCSILEIYRETLCDLLCSDRNDLKIKESATKGIYVEGLTEIVLIFLYMLIILNSA